MFDDFGELETRLPFYISFSTFWNVPGGLCTLFSFHEQEVTFYFK